MDVEILLQAISDDNPTGEGLSLYEGELLELKDLADKARRILKEESDKEAAGGFDSQGQPWPTIDTPEWEKIVELGSHILTNRSKDFRVAAWFAEAKLRTDGIEGFAQGMRVLVGFTENFWSGIHPAATEDDGHQETVSALGSFGGELAAKGLLETVFIRGKKQGAREEQEFTVADFQRARELESLSGEDRQKRLDEDDRLAEMAEIQAVAANVSDDDFRLVLQHIEDSADLLKRLREFLNSNCQPDEYDDSTVPNLSNLEDNLQLCRKAVVEFVSDEADEEEDGEEPSGEASSGQSDKRGAMTRERAFQQIEEMASFFERTEPHSPVSFALRQAVRWGKTPLPDLLTELIDDSSVMSHLNKLIGLPRESDDY